MLRPLPQSRVTRAFFVPFALAATLLVAACVPTAGGGTAAAAGSANSLGAYVGYQSPGGVQAFGQAVGEQPSFAMDFLDGDTWSGMLDQASSYMAAWEGSGLTMIWGVPMLPAESSGTDESSRTGYSLQLGATGAYNTYFLQLAQDMVAGGEANSIIRIGWEFNGGWFPWAATGQAAAFIGYWQQIVDTMRSVPGQQFTFEWNPTIGGVGSDNLADYYPGNAYVDYIGLDVYDQAWGYYGAPGCSGTACQQDEFNTILTEPFGLNWLASFAGQQGKAIVLPEWGPGAFNPTDLNGTYEDEELGGGDDPTFINDMMDWIDTNDVFEASYWDFQQDTTNSAPLSAAALRNDLAEGPPPATGPISSGGSATSSSSSSGTSGTAGVTSSSSGDFTPSPVPVFPTNGQADPAVTISGPPTGLVTSKGAHVSAILSTVGTGRGSGRGRDPRVRCGGAVSPRQQRDQPSPRHDQKQRGTQRPRGRRRSLHGLRLKPRQCRVDATSASVTRPVAKADSRTRIRVPHAVASGASAVLTATVVGRRPAAAGKRTGTVTFSVVGSSGQALTCTGGDTVPLVSGVATCDTTAAVATGSPYVVTATYSGDNTFNVSTSSTRTIKVR